MSEFWGNQKALTPRWLQAGKSAPGGSDGGDGGAPLGGGGGSYLPGPQPTPVEFPRHLFPPAGVDTIDMRIVRQMDPGETFDLIDFQPSLLNILGNVYITHYAIFNDGLLEDSFSFLPTINGMRIYPYHGNPAKNFLISLGLAPDEANYALIPGFLTMNPQDRLKWTAYNKDTVSVAMGVRVTGYVDQTSKRVVTRFGG